MSSEVYSSHLKELLSFFILFFAEQFPVSHSA